MKPAKRPALRTQALDTSALEKVSGGRGGFCGSQIHCDCGYAWEFYGGSCPDETGMYVMDIWIWSCPNCGASKDS